jgi:spore coat polysaccharide biosynthesis protein SpsF
MNAPDCHIVIQARMGSTRLPGKVLRPLAGRPVLSWVIRAAMLAEATDDVVVATTTSSDDDQVAALADAQGARVVRGSVDDVISRFTTATADDPDDDLVVRLTADCPFADPALIRASVAYARRSDAELVTNALPPRTTPHGLDVEVLSVGALRRASAAAVGVDRTHVTSWLYREPDRCRIETIGLWPPADDLRITLDTTEDAELLDVLAARLGDRAPSWVELVNLLRSAPELAGLNRQVRQKTLDEG